MQREVADDGTEMVDNGEDNPSTSSTNLASTSAESQHNSEASNVAVNQQQNISIHHDTTGSAGVGVVAGQSDSVRSTPKLSNDRTSKNGSQMQLSQLAPGSGSGGLSACGLSGANSTVVDEGDTITVIERPVHIETSEPSKSPLGVVNTTSVRLSLLPWNSHNRSAILSGNSGSGMVTTIDMMAASDGTLRPGEIVMRTLFTDFTVQAEKKIECVMLDGSDRNLPKLLQRGEDYQFDQLLQALGSVAEHCLPSLLKALLAWHKHQICDKNIKRDLQTGASSTAHHPANKSGFDLDYQLLRREAAVEFIFCLALIEILRQFPFHPGHDDITKQIENLAFRQFKYKEGAQTAPNANDNYRIADLYAEVVGVLAQSRFSSVRKRFMTELKELRSKEPSPFTTHSIISLLMGMKFFRVKMAPIEEFEASFQFMHECAQYFLEVKDKDIKHAMAGLFVEILVPVAATVKNEVNVPCVKNFIDLLYSQTLDACTKSKHKLALFPLVTCLLCVSQKSFFLSNWHCFLAMCLSNLKNKDPKMSRVALESLYRLLWVYIIRIKCESNSATHSRLQSIVNSLFPRGSKAVVPRDTPLNIFVKIIQFIAQERLDFAMREIVFELLCVGRPIKIIMTPERMSIGLRAFMVVADSLQQKDGEPPMPRTVGVLPSGNTLRVKKTYLNKMLTEDTARSIGMSNYFPHVRRVFVDILRALDIHCGRPLMMTVIQNQNKELDEMLTGERKPRIDLFRTCIAAVPRLTPDNMTGHELVDMLSRLTIHMDEELRRLAHQSLQTLVCDFPEWRQDVIQGFSQFLARDVVDTFPQLLDNGLRMLYAFLTVWRNLLGAGSNNNSNSNTLNTKGGGPAGTGGGGVPLASAGQPVIGRATNQQDLGMLKPNLTQSNVNASLNAATINSNSSGSSGISSITQTTTITAGAIGVGAGTTSSSGIGGTGDGTNTTAAGSTTAGGKKGHELPLATTMHMVEGLALVMLCNCRSPPRKFAVSILKEVKILKKLLGIPETEPALIDVIDKCCPQVLEKCLHMLPQTDRTAMLNANIIDLQWIVDRNSGIWTTGHVEESTKASTLTLCLSQSALGQAYDPWSVCLFGFMERTRVLQHCPSVVAQAWPICYQRVTSLFNVIDPTPVSDNRASLLRSSAPTKKPPSEAQRDSLAHLWKNQVALAMRLIPQMPSVAVRCASPDLSLSSSPDSLSADRSDKSSGTSASPVALYKLVIPLLRCEVVDIRDAAVNALGMINHDALKDLMEELVVYIREAIDRKQENMRRRRRRDALRLQLVRVLEKIAENGTFGISQFVLERETMSLHPTFVEYIDGARLYLETETDGKDSSSMREVKTHFCDFIRKMIKNFSLESCGTLLSRELKRNLVNLFVGWSGTAYALPFAHGHHGSSHHGSHHGVGAGGSGGGSISGIGSGVSGIGGGTIGASVWGSSSTTAGISSAANTSVGTIAAEEEKLQFSALQAMSAVLCCGPCFDPGHLAEDGAIYSWLDMLMTSKDEKIYELAKETVVLLLESNPDIGQLLEWVIDRCYTASPREADACFLALAVIFSAREYPCDHYTSVINVTLLMTGCPRVEVHSTALQLLQILDKRFFGNVGPLQTENDREPDKIGTLDAVLSGAYCRSQMYLSRQIARLRPELTMSMFSEITYRFQTARAEARALLLQCLLPWLENVELVASSVPPATPLSYIMYYPDSGTRGRREGSGSTEATEMILNNLFYITAKFADSHPYIEELWGTLCQFWPNNLKVILRYLLIISGMAPNELLANAKRVALYLARSCTNRLLDELMSELQTVETLNCLIERTETPPFYRLTSMRKASSHSDGPASGNNDPKLQDVDVEKGTIHTKRHSGEDPIKSGTCKSDSALRTFANAYRPPRGSDKIRTASGPCVLPRHEDVMMMMNEPEMNQEDNFVQIRTEQPTAPHPLPMPEYGGYFAPLTEFLPDTNIPISGFHRCNVAVMLLTDIVVDGIPGLDWTLHVPLMLHILFLGLDHTRRIVRDHCKKLLLNLLIVLAEHNDHLTVAKILLNSDTSRLRLGIVVPSLPVIDHNFTEPDQEFDSYLFGLNSTSTQQSVLSPASNQPNEETPAVPMIVTEENAPPQPGPTMPTAHVIKSLIKFLSNESSQQHPLWNYEDITAKVWSIKSADQLQCFLRHIVKAFTDSYPHARIPERWAQTALQLGLSCSSRHYAGRSLQVFRSLNVPINSRMLSDILSRLIETVAEQGEDMQGYVTELLLTLEAAVDSLDSDFRPLDVMKDIFKSTPNLNNKEGVVSSMYSSSKRSGDGGITGGSPGQSLHNATSGGHTRSTSYSISYCSRKAANSPIDKQIELRNRNAALEIERNAAKFGAGQTSLSRSRSAQSLKLLGDTATQDDKMTILAQLFWLAVSLLESDYEHEFLLALRLLTRVLHRLPLDRPDARDKVEKLQQQLKWSTYPGVHALLLKGCTHSGTYEASIALLSQLTPLLNLPVCDPTQSCAFPMNVIALLPYMLLHYEDANEICIRSAENIAQVASEMGLKLENLGTVMTLYSRKTFSKESFQWTKCVVKYLYDTYAHMGLHMLAFLTEVLEKGWVQVQLQVLSVIHCMLHYVDLSAVAIQPIAGDMLRIISKYLDSPNWKEALKILKFVVTRSSSLQVVPQSSEGGGGGGGGSSFANLHGSFSDSEVFCKKELAGRTMEFSFDVSQTPLIGRKLLLKSDHDTSAPSGVGGGTQMGGKGFNGSSNVTGSGAHYGGHAGTPNSPRRSASLSPADTAPLSGWKRPWMSQGRVRECLVNLLTTCGQRVGLPKSPSVIFSQSSDLLERQSSAASSTDETSGAQQDLSGGSKRDDGAPDFGVFKDFDFLEYESESIEGESTDNFNWGVRRRPLSEGENEPHSLSAAGVRASHTNIDESLSEKTPVFNRRKRPNADDSSDEEVESESPLDEEPRPIFTKAAYLSGPPTSLSLRERRHRRDSVSRSDTSGSSAGDLGDITPCNASPHLPGMHPFRTGPIRDESVDVWRRNLVGLLVNQPSSHAPDLLNQMFRLIKELTVRSIAISKECMRYFTGCGMQLGHRISVLSDLLATRGDPPKIWYHQSLATTPRLFENLRYGVLEVQEHLETFFDRKETVLDSLDEVKTSCKLALFTSDIDSANEGTGGSSAVVSLSTSTDPATAELLLDLGRGLYKLMFQLLLLIESDHKIAISVVQNLRQNEQMQDLSNLYLSVRGALLRCIDDAEMESLDTSTSTEGENTPTPSPGLPMNNSEFENILVELIDNQRWSAAINHVKQHKQMSNHSASNYNLSGGASGSSGGGSGVGGMMFASGGGNCSITGGGGVGDGLFANLGTEFKPVDDLSIILNVYAHRLTKDRNDVFIVSRSELELSEIYQILMENLLHVSSALSNMEISMKANTSSSSSTVTTMTTIPAVIGTGPSTGPGNGGTGNGHSGAPGNAAGSLAGSTAQGSSNLPPPPPPVLAPTNPFKDTVDIITTL